MSKFCYSPFHVSRPIKWDTLMYLGEIIVFFDILVLDTVPFFLSN